MTKPTPFLTLVADDSDVEHALIHRFMRFVPEVRLIGEVQDGLQAVSYLRGASPFSDRSKFPYPDLLLLDYQMPRLNGMEVLGLLKDEEIRPLIIFWSNTIEQVDQELAIKLGANVVCQKPSGGLEMRMIINRIDGLAASSALNPAGLVRSLPLRA
jgi:CheY-like chemotaxis protein